MDVRSLTPDGLFRAVYTPCAGDPKTWLLDVRDRKQYVKGHALHAYCVRLASSDPHALLDYSKAQYDHKWSKGCWWGKPVVVYGDAGLTKQHPVVDMLAQEKRASSLAIYKEGLQGLSKHYPFLVTSSMKGAIRRYPSEILPQVLYLSDWETASDFERLQELRISRVITVHNSPENMKLPEGWEHLKLTLADVETQDISPFFAPAFDFIEQGKLKQQATLVHCGAGVSRSAALCIAYLMRRLSWTADQARAHCKARRSLVDPNAGFWRSLCALEEVLGLAKRSDPGSASFSGSDAPVQLAANAAGEKVSVSFVPLKQLVARSAKADAKEEPAKDESSGLMVEGVKEEPGDEGPLGFGSSSEGEKGGRGPMAEGTRDRVKVKEGEGKVAKKGRERSRERERPRDRSRSRERGKERRRERSRSGERERRRKRSRSRVRGEGKDKARREDMERGADKRAAGKERSPKRAFSANGETGSSAAQQAPAAEPKAAGEKLGGKEVVLKVSKEGKLVGLLELGMRGAHASAVVGRDPSCALFLEHLSISRRHAHLTTDVLGNLYLTDLNSAHRTWADGVWLRPETPRRLIKGASFRFGASLREYTVLKTPKDPPLPADFVPT